MSGWIDWAAVGKIVGVGLLAGAGLPALFALGLRLVTPAGAPAGPNPATETPSAPGVRVSSLALVAGSMCFAIVVAALAYGIYLIVDK